MIEVITRADGQARWKHALRAGCAETVKAGSLQTGIMQRKRLLLHSMLSKKYHSHLKSLFLACRCVPPLACVMHHSCPLPPGSCLHRPWPRHSLLSSNPWPLSPSCSQLSIPATTWRSPLSARSARWQSTMSRCIQSLPASVHCSKHCVACLVVVPWTDQAARTKLQKHGINQIAAAVCAEAGCQVWHKYV